MIQSEFRQDPTTGDWILIAPGRSRYFNKHRIVKKARTVAPVGECPFEDGKVFDNVSEKILVQYGRHREVVAGRGHKNVPGQGKFFDWDIIVLQNKYPVVVHKDKTPKVSVKGPYRVMEGIGHHDLLVTRDHNANFPKLKPESAAHVFEAFRDRYLSLLADKNIAYISLFHNWGPLSGATIYHPHYQIISVPIIPPHIAHSVEDSSEYFKKHKKCLHCVQIAWERKHGKRVIFENDEAIAFAPFISRAAFEVQIFPKRHRPFFENTQDDEMVGVVNVLQRVLRQIEKNLADPDYNFFIHTAPIKNKEKSGHYHWHIEVLPKFRLWGGFEFSTGMEIDGYDPDLVAKILRKK
jgi:UDPglucose--hexose-1-phosphate uridylyltransferase